MNVIVVGSLNLDHVLHLDKYPDRGETVFSEGSSFAVGGKGANQAIAAKRFGASVFMIGKIGNDRNGEVIKQTLVAEGVDTSFVSVHDGETGVAYIHVESEGDNRIIVNRGANNHLCKSDIDNAEKAFMVADALLIQLEIPIETVDYAISKAIQYSIPVFLDPAPVSGVRMMKTLDKVDWILPNEIEAEALTGTSIEDVKTGRIAAAKTIQLGPRYAIIKLGANGALCAFENDFIHSSSPEVRVEDTTAAGDVFAAGFATSLFERNEISYALQFANAAGALATTKHGAVPSIPSLVEITDLLVAAEGRR